MPRRMRRKKSKRRGRRNEAMRVNVAERRRLKRIDYKDTDTLRRFMTKHGRIMSRKRTGITAGQQRAIKKAIKRARYMALLPYTTTRRKRR